MDCIKTDVLSSWVDLDFLFPRSSPPQSIENQYHAFYFERIINDTECKHWPHASYGALVFATSLNQNNINKLHFTMEIIQETIFL